MLYLELTTPAKSCIAKLFALGQMLDRPWLAFQPPHYLHHSYFSSPSLPPLTFLSPLSLSSLPPPLPCIQFCKDMWLMFDNAWIYNKKTSRVYKYCTKLSEVFDMHINGAMQRLGYCCGMRVSEEGEGGGGRE